MGYGTEKQNLKNNEGIRSRAAIEEKVSNKCTRGVPALELEFLQEKTSKLKKKNATVLQSTYVSLCLNFKMPVNEKTTKINSYRTLKWSNSEVEQGFL